jgi:monovalent cation/hydrogen antiporter
MQNFEIIILVLAVLITFLSFADKFRLPSPVLLVFVGIGIGFIPAMPSVVLDPQVVFFLFLPTILYDASSHTSWHDFKMEIRPIATLAIALVLFTTFAVAAVSHFFIPGFTWALGFLLGAIVSPPDAVAATSITKGLGLNRRVVTILEGESLINDASALIAYKFAIVAIGTGTFVFWQAGLKFLLSVSGGVIAGVLIGFMFSVIHKKITDNSIISASLTLLTPFIAYLTAEHFHFSGVLSVVSTGMVMSWRAPAVFSYQTRIRTKAVWETIIFLINGLIFILIGLQLPSVLKDLQDYSFLDLMRYALMVSVVTILIRILWVFVAAFSPWAKNSALPKNENDNTWKNVLIVAWTGTRGVVSLATGLALPLTLTDGTAFPNRSLILFLTCVVIFVTLVIQGMSLPLLIRALGIKKNVPSSEEEELRLLMVNHVLEYIDNVSPYEVDSAVKNRLRKHYTDLADTLIQKLQTPAYPQIPKISDYLKAQLKIHSFERDLLIQYHKEGTFTHELLKRIEQELDQQELQFNQRRARKKSTAE